MTVYDLVRVVASIYNNIVLQTKLDPDFSLTDIEHIMRVIYTNSVEKLAVDLPTPEKSRQPKMKCHGSAITAGSTQFLIM